MSEYKISEQDIQSMIRILKDIDPEQANEERALGYLQWIKARVREVSTQDPSNEDLYKLFSASLGE